MILRGRGLRGSAFIIITMILVSVDLEVAHSQQKGRDRVRELEERITALEQKASSEPVRVESEVHAVGEIAKMTLESYERNFGIIRWVATAVSVLVGLFAFFGFRQFTQVVAPLRPLRRDHENLMQQVREESGKLSELGSKLAEQRKELESYRDRMLKDVEGLIRTVSAFTYTQTDKLEFHRAALREVEKALEREPSHPKVVGWAYSIRGYLVRRLVAAPDGLLQALEHARRAIEIDPENERACYNAACYACLLGRTVDWITWLTRATELNPAFKNDALDDPDFSSARETPDFKRITGQG